MIWGKGSVSNVVFNASVALLGFNEPNHAKQANISAAQAAALWPQLQQKARAMGVPLGSPSAAPCTSSTCNGGDYMTWFNAFFAACTGCQVDFLTSHYYGCSASGLQTFLSNLAKYNLPIWLTEFNCGGGSLNASLSKHMAYMQAALPILEANPMVIKYAWMSARNTHPFTAALFTRSDNNTAALTALGALYFNDSYTPLCAAGQYVAQPATLLSNTVCANWTTCDPAYQYQASAPTLTSDTVCAPTTTTTNQQF